MKEAEMIMFATYLANGTPMEIVLNKMQDKLNLFKKDNSPDNYQELQSSILILTLKMDIIEVGLAEALRRAQENWSQADLIKLMRTKQSFN